MCLFFFSCEKEEMVSHKETGEGDEFYINPEDTAGIIVPEGYSLVIFPANQAMTKAAGSETRIQHLQYLVYQDDRRGNYIQFYDNRKVNTDLSSWPVKAIAISLPKDKSYKVVFLGNVDKSLFGKNQTKDLLFGTGKGTNYKDGRILLPNVEFFENSMYFFAKADFSTNAIAYVPITLKRIVSRNDITKEGLSAAYANGITSDAAYKTAYWTQTLKEKMKEAVFTGVNSSFKYQVGEAIKRNLIYPLIYIGMANPANAPIWAANYSAVAKYNEEWDAYKPPVSYLNLLDDIRRSYSDLITLGAQPANNLFIRYAQYQYDTFVEENSKDPQVLKAALEKIYADNIAIVENNISQPSVDKAIKIIVAALGTNYTAGSLLPFRLSNYNSNSVIQINPAAPMPGAVDFELNTDPAYNITGEKYYRINNAPNYASDKYISVISLGESQTSSNKLIISKLHGASSGGYDIDYVPSVKQEIIGTEFYAGSFHRNIKSVTTQTIQNVSLVDPKLLMQTPNNIQKIQVNYYHLLEAMKPIDNNNSITIGIDPRAKFTIQGISYPIPKISTFQSYILNTLNYQYIRLDLEDLTAISFPFVTFTCPVVSPSNLNVTAVWNTSEVQ